MAAEAARVLDYPGADYYGSAAPARAPYFEEGSASPAREPYYEPEPEAAPRSAPAPQVRAGAKPAAGAAVQRAPAVSLFAVFGAVFAGVLMFFVILAQISYAEISSESVRMGAQLEELIEQERRLEIVFESAIDMKAVERYARDTLGMSKPDADQVVVIRSAPADTAEIIDSGGSAGAAGGFGDFIKSLLDYLR